MRPTQDVYPSFEANQVLTSGNLNQDFDYLDEQERLTRANLIGIGIVCGLELRIETGAAATVHVSRGCGVTSQGYLLVEPDDLALVSYREYTPPDDLDYPPFRNSTLPDNPWYPLWELFPAGEPDTSPLSLPADFLERKAVLLFLELKKEGLRNCSPNNCDDKGAGVTATVRPLLVRVGDLDEIIAKANALGSGAANGGLAGADIEAALLARLNLPDLRMPRYDVPATAPASSQDVLAAFHTAFRSEQLAHATGKALSAAYQAFEPLLAPSFPSDPFAAFQAAFGFLDNAPATAVQVRFLQYYYDFFGDLRGAYDEFRWKGAELMCACCPPDGLFPRHLMLGLAGTAGAGDPGIHRNHFLRSSATGACEDRRADLEQLFKRLVEMIARFTDTPKLPQPTGASRTDTQIRITPSRMGEVRLSDKAIPYYYRQDGTPPLFQFWNAALTRRNRANQNLGYRSDEYVPPGPVFVTDPLRYDLEPFNFLRVEGHLGKSFQSVLTALLSMRSRYRLPIDIIALRTGAFDETIQVDLSKEQCRFQDLEALYNALRDEFRCSLGKTLASLYDKKVDRTVSLPQGFTPSVIGAFRPGFPVAPSTFGSLVETHFTAIGGSATVAGSVPRPDASLVDAVIGERPVIQASASFVDVLLQIDAFLNGKALSAFDLSEFQGLYGRLEGIQASIARQPEAAKKEWKDLADLLDTVRYACRMEAFKSIAAEYQRRLLEVKQKQFLSVFLQKHPGIQHKAGVPTGGTFILVYHDAPDRVRPRPGLTVGLASATTAGAFAAAVRVPGVAEGASGTAGTSSGAAPASGAAGTSGLAPGAAAPFDEASAKVLTAAFGRLEANRDLVMNPDLQTIFGELAGQIPTLSFFPGRGQLGKDAEKMINDTVSGLADGTVIADFFLPYLCSSDCAPVQYTLPAPRPGFDVQLDCTDAGGRARATIRPQGGIAPFSYKLDDQPFTPLAGKPVLAVGAHTVLLRDSVGAESETQTVTVPAVLAIGQETFIDNEVDGTYRVRFAVSGGTPPYAAGAGALADVTFTSDPVQSGVTLKVEIHDSTECIVSKEFRHTVCTLPCAGKAERCRYLFWMPEPPEGKQYQYESVKADIDITNTGGSALLQADLLQLFRQALPDGTTITAANYDGEVAGLLKALNGMIVEKIGEGSFVFSRPPNERGTIAVEHYACHSFNFRVQIALKQEDVAIEESWTYSRDGVKVQQKSPSVVSYGAAAFGCVEMDKCDGSIKKDCTISIKDINGKITQSSVRMKPVFSSAIDEGSAKFLWRTEYGSPAFSTAKEVVCKFPSSGQIKARLLVVDANGCWGYFEKEFRRG